MRTRPEKVYGDYVATDKTKASEIPDRVFETFIEALAKAEVDEGIQSRLRAALLVDRSYGDRALKEAIFPEIFDL